MVKLHYYYYYYYLIQSQFNLSIKTNRQHGAIIRPTTNLFHVMDELIGGLLWLFPLCCKLHHLGGRKEVPQTIRAENQPLVLVWDKLKGIHLGGTAKAAFEAAFQVFVYEGTTRNNHATDAIILDHTSAPHNAH